MIKVRLTPKEMSKANQMAQLRSQLARASGVVDQKRANEKGIDIDLLGIKAEIAAAKVLGVDYDVHNLGIDDGADLWFDDLAIDVKATMSDGDRLLFKSEAAFRANFALLTHGTDEADVIAVRGGTSRRTFLDRAKVQNLGYGDTLVMENFYLTPIQEVWLFLMQRRLK